MSNFGEGRWMAGRKDHRCEYCYGPIPKGEEHFYYRGMYDGEWQNWRMHRECYEGYEIDAQYSGDWEFMPGEADRPERVKQIAEVKG